MKLRFQKNSGNQGFGALEGIKHKRIKKIEHDFELSIKNFFQFKNEIKLGFQDEFGTPKI